MLVRFDDMTSRDWGCRARGLGGGAPRSRSRKLGWDTIRWKQDLLERTCIAIAVTNFRLLDAHTRAS